MYDQKRQKRNAIIRRTVVYACMTSATVILASYFLFSMLGYHFNPQTQTVEQDGLVQFDSFPRGANISIDGVYLDKTQSKSLVAAGQRQFFMQRDGYKSWQKTLAISPDTVTQLDYVRLVPEKMKTNDAADVTGLKTAAFSPDRRAFVGVSAVNNEPSLVWGELGARADVPQVKQYPFPEGILAGYDDAAIVHNFEIKEWDKDSRFALLVHAYTENDAQKTQWLRLDARRPAEVVDLTKLAGLDIGDMHFIGGGGNDAYFLQTNGELRRMDVANATFSRPLISNVRRFHLYGTDMISYIAVEAEREVAGVWKQGWREPYVVQRLAPQQRVEAFDIRVSRYFQKDTIAVLLNNTITFYRGALNSQDALPSLFEKPRTLGLGRTITQFSISDNGRFIIAADKTGFISYDLERQTISQEAATTGVLRWLDGYHLWYRQENGTVTMTEFDGLNAAVIAKDLAPGFGVALSADEKSVLSFAHSDEGDVYHLRRTAMTIE